MVGAVAGGYLSARLPDDVLLVTIGLVLVYFGGLSERQLLRATGVTLRVAGLVCL